MCGIFCKISPSNDQTSCDHLLDEFKFIFQNSIARRGPNSLKTVSFQTGPSNFLFASSILWLQGPELVEQPLVNEKSIFVYNGDIFGSSQCSNAEMNNVGDTKIFFQMLEKSKDLMYIVENLEGPYAFVYLDKFYQKLYFGRDVYGRRSLLIGKHNEDIIITSVAKKNTKYSFVELPCAGVFCIDINKKFMQIYPWKKRNKNFTQKVKEIESFLGIDVFVEASQFEEPIPFKAPSEFQVEIVKTLSCCSSNEILDTYCSNALYLDDIVKLRDLMEKSIKKRILTQPKFCQNCINKSSECSHAITGVLFSGGVDCAILAFLADKFINQKHSIDLINVAFEKNGNYNTPDRLTGISTLKELQTLCPHRNWNFVEVNVSTEELNECRINKISDLIYPLNSILDDSLGCALWFASRGSTTNYTSPCRTLLVGMGADELFGGYTRHRAALQNGNWQILHDVLEEDWQNLPYRNLARDDRVVSDHGRQLRTPYLDEEVVKFVQGLSCWQRTIPSKELPQGIGEKIMLRGLAHHLGLKNAAVFKKRALQFGSRIANSKEKGHEVSDRLK